MNKNNRYIELINDHLCKEKQIYQAALFEIVNENKPLEIDNIDDRYDIKDKELEDLIELLDDEEKQKNVMYNIEELEKYTKNTEDEILKNDEEYYEMCK